MSEHRDDPIVAIATAAGRGGIGVVRLSFGRWSGQPIVSSFIAALCAKPADFRLVPRHATLVGIRDRDGRVVDRGIALLFAAPHSYNGEDIVELQLHGGPVVLRMVVERCLAVAHDVADQRDEPARLRPAAPGEFTERAFLNNKLDLAQAEAVADLIEAGSEAAVLGAQASLSGTFSIAIRALVDRLIALRALVEATLDFPDEEIDFLEKSDARGRLAAIRASLETLMQQARRGAVLREGLTVVLAGRPNVGKSSLLNALAESDVAIVTPIAGTTRDRIEQTIRLEGIAFHIVDTAGIRVLDDDDRDAVERIGIERTWQAIATAHVVLHLVDASGLDETEDAEITKRLPMHALRRTVVNKIDLTGEVARHDADRLFVSAKTGDGMDLLRAELLSIAGWRPGAEVGFLARERHLVAMREADSHLAIAVRHADQGDSQLELLAEELRLAQAEFGRITGVVSADDLLGEIFGRFCIGK